jgi:hypothetical protein
MSILFGIDLSCSFGFGMFVGMLLMMFSITRRISKNMGIDYELASDLMVRMLEKK